MKNLVLFTILIAPLTAAAQKLKGNTYLPVAIESGTQKKAIVKDSAQFMLQFIDDKNILYREIKEGYYTSHHCVYELKGKSLYIQFLQRNKRLNYELVSAQGNELVLKDTDKLLHLTKVIE